RWPGRALALDGATNDRAAAADLVVVATPWDAAAATASLVGPHLAGKLVVSMANAVARVGDGFEPLVTARGSVAAQVQAAVPEALVAAALHHLPARQLAALDTPLDADVLVCSDHPAATKAAIELVAMVPGLRAFDAGTLANAAPVEAFTAVLLQLNLRYRTHTTLRVTGLDGGTGGAPGRHG
ncbi:MAG: NAD(P)-binding domain-containing protein, partial [Acidimicrobiales bacterium]